MGRIEADFHCLGTVDEESDRFIMSANGAAKIGEPIRRNQAGMLSSPEDVGRRVSKMLKICHSETCEDASMLLQVLLTPGAV